MPEGNGQVGPDGWGAHEVAGPRGAFAAAVVTELPLRWCGVHVASAQSVLNTLVHLERPRGGGGERPAIHDVWRRCMRRVSACRAAGGFGGSSELLVWALNVMHVALRRTDAT